MSVFSNSVLTAYDQYPAESVVPFTLVLRRGTQCISYIIIVCCLCLCGGSIVVVLYNIIIMTLVCLFGIAPHP